jgi:ergothioneine biosynthesis protein EgtB
MLELIAQPLTDESRNLIVLGLNHEQQHQELLLTDLKYTFSVNPTCPVYDTDNVICQQPENLNVEFIPMPGGIYRIGHSGAGFCFDNEQAAHEVNLEDFSISAALVTNGQFLEFIADGGYQKFSLWHSEGWDWVKQNSVDSPLYWRKVDDEWRQFTLAGQQTLNPDAPVSHISFYEAFAYAEWKGCRLPTEFEWEAASDKFNWGRRWEWTHSAYLPYPRYRKAAGAVGEYNGKFMINQMVLRGASDATPPEHSRKTYRNFFHPHLRWQFTGLRLAK